MPEQRTPEGANDWPAMQRKLIWRMFFAILMILALLGGLAVFDYLSKNSESEPAFPQFTEPVPVTKKIQPRAVAPVEEAAAAKGRQAPAEPEGSAAPVDKSAPGHVADAQAEGATQGVLPKTASTPGRASGPVGKAPTTLKSLPSKDVKTDVKTDSAAPATDASQAPESSSASSRQIPPPPIPVASGYVLRTGQFAGLPQAEELLARLQMAGIPATLEARVQAGPFKNQGEARAAKARMKKLGIDATLLPPPKKRR